MIFSMKTRGVSQEGVISSALTNQWKRLSISICPIPSNELLKNITLSFNAVQMYNTDMTAAELVLISLLYLLEVKGDCPSETCQKISLNVHQDSEQDTEFVGHVFHNSITLNPVQCYMWCIRDCRCLSINYKENPQNDTKYCELNEGNHFISKSSLVKSSGSRYFALRKEYSKVKVRIRYTW